MRLFRSPSSMTSLFIQSPTLQRANLRSPEHMPSRTNPPFHSNAVARWNSAGTVKGSSLSIRSNRSSYWDLLFADGGSTDGTVDPTSMHKCHVAWSYSTRDHGIYDAWYRAISHAHGEHICFLDADDAWADEHALSRCPRFGPWRAWLAWLDKLWRYPVARVLGIPH